MRSSGLRTGSFHDRAATTKLMAVSGGWRSAFDDERVVLPCRSSSSIYGGAGPPPLRRWHESSSPTAAWMHGACRHGGPWGMGSATSKAAPSSARLEPRQWRTASSILGKRRRIRGADRRQWPWIWASRA
jgi:hypothetical protein